MCCVYKKPGRGARGARRDAACWLLGALEEAGRKCAHAVHANAENVRLTAKDNAMASRPTQRNTKSTYARPGTKPNGPAIAPRGARRAARLLPVAAAVAATCCCERHRDRRQRQQRRRRRWRRRRRHRAPVIAPSSRAIFDAVCMPPRERTDNS